MNRKLSKYYPNKLLRSKQTRKKKKITKDITGLDRNIKYNIKINDNLYLGIALLFPKIQFSQKTKLSRTAYLHLL